MRSKRISQAVIEVSGNAAASANDRVFWLRSDDPFVN